jgi:hypothetical protein
MLCIFQKTQIPWYTRGQNKLISLIEYKSTANTSEIKSQRFYEPAQVMIINHCNNFRKTDLLINQLWQSNCALSRVFNVFSDDENNINKPKLFGCYFGACISNKVCSLAQLVYIIYP